MFHRAVFFVKSLPYRGWRRVSSCIFWVRNIKKYYLEPQNYQEILIDMKPDENDSQNPPPLKNPAPSEWKLN